MDSNIKIPKKVKCLSCGEELTLDEKARVSRRLNCPLCNNDIDYTKLKFKDNLIPDFDLKSSIIRFCSICGIVLFLLANITYFLPDIVSPSKPEPSGSETSNIMDQLNYQSDKTIIDNLRENRKQTGYLGLILIFTGAGIGLGLAISFGIYSQDKERFHLAIDEVLGLIKNIPEEKIESNLQASEKIQKQDKPLPPSLESNANLPEIIKCPECKEELKLEENERTSKQFTCSGCGRAIDLTCPKNGSSIENSGGSDNPVISSKGTWTCVCGEVNPEKATYCNCSRYRPDRA